MIALIEYVEAFNAGALKLGCCPDWASCDRCTDEAKSRKRRSRLPPTRLGLMEAEADCFLVA